MAKTAEQAIGTGRRWIVPMRSRSPEEEHRAATPLELFFDLVFVVAIAQAAERLHHAIAEAQVGAGLLSYGMVFFAIWWAWMNFTWFASAYDTDDVPYRLAVFVQLTGALILAAGVPRAFDERDLTVVTVGYVVTRLALVGQWLRAARSDPPRRPGSLRYALGAGICQLGWVGLLFAPAPWRLPGFFGLATAELLVPIWAERAARTHWHPEHIKERYGLFTIIVLGESILAASIAIQSVTQETSVTAELATIMGGALLIVFSMWWLYFDQPEHCLLDSLGTAFIWGYGHLLIFASAAAVGAGLAVAIDQAASHTAIGAFGAGKAVAVPVAIYLTCLGALHAPPRSQRWGRSWLLPAVAGLVLLTPFTGRAVLSTGVLLAALLGVKLVRLHRRA